MTRTWKAEEESARSVDELSSAESLTEQEAVPASGSEEVATSASGEMSSASERGLSENTSSSDSDKAGQPKPTQRELVEEAKKLQREADDLRSRLVEDRLVLLEKRLKVIEAGIAWVGLGAVYDLVEGDEELNAKLAEISSNRATRQKAAEERYRLRIETIKNEYSSSDIQVRSEHQAALQELVQAKERQARLKATVNLPPEVVKKGRDTAGHEFPQHVEKLLPKSLIDEDLARISRELKQAPPSNGKEDSHPAKVRRTLPE